MAVITHAFARPTTVDYRDLPTSAQAVIDRAMEKADHAPPGKDYAEAMEYVAIAAGLPFPACGDLAVCSCLNDAFGCGCGVIFATDLAGVVVTATNAPNRNLSELQCPTCGHDHPRPITD